MSKTYQVRISGMTCASCERMIAKCVSKIEGAQVLAVSAQDGSMSVRASDGRGEDIRRAVHEAGYQVLEIRKADEAGKAQGGENPRESAESGSANTGPAATDGADCGTECGESSFPDVPSARDVWNGIMGSGRDWMPERTLLTHATGSLTALFVLLAFMYFGLWRNVPDFFTVQMPLLVMGAVSVVAIVGAGYHFNTYKRTISCSIGMMEGMTFGMMTGFMIGALVGATSGMFWGSVIGMLIGCAAGVWAGWRSGVMGVMEGLMAGVMAGTMGAMLSVMLLASPLIQFLALLIAFCVLILIALAYMQVKELGKLDHRDKNVGTFISMASTSVIFFLLLTVVMIYGPKLGPVWGG